MKKRLLILLLLPIILCGCTTLGNVEKKSNNISCIDGIEYLRNISYGGWSIFTVHFSYDENNNPKVIRCGDNK